MRAESEWAWGQDMRSLSGADGYLGYTGRDRCPHAPLLMCASVSLALDNPRGEEEGGGEGRAGEGARGQSDMLSDS